MCGTWGDCIVPGEGMTPLPDFSSKSWPGLASARSPQISPQKPPFTLPGEAGSSHGLCVCLPHLWKSQMWWCLYFLSSVRWKSQPCLWATSIFTSSWASSCSGWTQNLGKVVEVGQVPCFLTGRQMLPNNSTRAWKSLGRIATNQITQPLLQREIWTIFPGSKFLEEMGNYSNWHVEKL